MSLLKFACKQFQDALEPLKSAIVDMGSARNSAPSLAPHPETQTVEAASYRLLATFEKTVFSLTWRVRFSDHAFLKERVQLYLAKLEALRAIVASYGQGVPDEVGLVAFWSWFEAEAEDLGTKAAESQCETPSTGPESLPITPPPNTEPIHDESTRDRIARVGAWASVGLWASSLVWLVLGTWYVGSSHSQIAYFLFAMGGLGIAGSVFCGMYLIGYLRSSIGAELTQWCHDTVLAAQAQAAGKKSQFKKPSQQSLAPLAEALTEWAARVQGERELFSKSLEMLEHGRFRAPRAEPCDTVPELRKELSRAFLTVQQALTTAHQTTKPPTNLRS